MVLKFSPSACWLIGHCAEWNTAIHLLEWEVVLLISSDKWLLELGG